MNFTFFSPVKIIFGPKTADTLPNVIARMTMALPSGDTVTEYNPPPPSGNRRFRKALVVMGSFPGRVENVIKALHTCNIPYEILCQKGEPTVEGLIPEVNRARSAHVDLVIAQGGGSVLDTGKALAALVPNNGHVKTPATTTHESLKSSRHNNFHIKNPIMHYLEIIGDGAPLTERPLPMIALPTTAGTGSEATKNAVLASLEHQVKVSLRNDFMYPDVAIIDPLLTTSMPREITASTGMDALTQLIESFTSGFATPITDALCRDGILRVARSLKKALETPEDIAARSDMALAGLYSGITLANAKLGAVHGIAGPMGGMVHAPHGAICARLLGPVMRENMEALCSNQFSKDLAHTMGETDRQSKSSMQSKYNTQLELAEEIMGKYGEIAQILTGDPDAPWQDGIHWVEEIVSWVSIPTLSDMGLKQEQMAVLAEKARQASSMKGNPVTLTLDQIKNLLSA